METESWERIKVLGTDVALEWMMGSLVMVENVVKSQILGACVLVFFISVYIGPLRMRFLILTCGKALMCWLIGVLAFFFIVRDGIGMSS